MIDKKGKFRPLVDGFATETTLQSVAGFNIPAYDTRIINETNPNNVIITYYKSAVLVATKTIAIVGDVTTVTVV